MAIQFKGSLGAGSSAVSSTSYTHTTTLQTVEVDEVAILVVVSDNTTLVTGVSNEQASVTDSSGNTWTKQNEYAHSPTGAAADGVTVGVWTMQATSQLLVGGTLTITFNSARTEKCSRGTVFTLAPGGTLGTSATAIATTTAGAFDFGAATFSGLASLERLWFRALGKEANTTTTLTPTTGFADIGNARSQNNTTAVLVRGEWLISTSSGETSDPALLVSGDTVGLFFPFKEIITNPSPDVPLRALTLTGQAVTLALKINLPGEA